MKLDDYGGHMYWEHINRESTGNQVSSPSLLCKFQARIFLTEAACIGVSTADERNCVEDASVPLERNNQVVSALCIYWANTRVRL